MAALGSQGEVNNYTLGRGEVYVDRLLNTTTFASEGERYIGNTPEFNLTISQEVLDHFSSDRGIREKDESVPLQVNRTGSMVCDNIDEENVALFFFGSKSEVSEAGGAETYEFGPVTQGRYYQLGVSDARPAGVKGVVGETDDSNSAGAFSLFEADSNSVGGTPYVAGTDYVLDADLGRVYIVPGGGIADNTNLLASYTVKAQTFDRVISGSEPVECSIRFIAFNPVGDDIDYFLPYCKISPNGDYALKSDEWQQIPFSVEVLKRSDREAIYADGRAVFA